MTPMTWFVTWTIMCASPGPPYEGPWRWPLTPAPAVLRAFDPPEEPWTAGHRGVDLAADPGRAVHAAGAGRVTYAARLAGRGVVVISHGALRTTYLPVRASVRPGRRVRAGDRIGTVERRPGHCGQVSCLHWGALRGPSYIDPLSLVGVGRIRLLPVWGVPPPSTSPPAGPPLPHRPLRHGPLRHGPLRHGPGAPRADPAQTVTPRGGPPVPSALPILAGASGAAAPVIASALAVRRARRSPPGSPRRDHAVVRGRSPLRRGGGPGGRSA
ncbi:murein hydrolase activator EnvC family protein [Actinomadura alba]|uniref:murein hydrolase activator EnvC family protein n=1 Tax=Actinomadura alba TaxID=406431 RepID=UPI001C9CE09C|nr:M23 family metallopeptidase [Actinomadura alba]